MRGYGLAAFVGTWVVIGSQAWGVTLVKFTGDADNDDEERSVATVLAPHVSARGFDNLRAAVGGDILYALPNKYDDINTARTDPETNTAFSITPAAGYELTITGLRFDLAANRISASAPSQVVTAMGISWNRDNYASPLKIGFASDITADGNFSRAVVSVPVDASSVNEPIVFRVFWAGNTNFTYFDNVEVLGTTSPIPEPASAALLTAAAALTLRRSSRRHV